MFTKSPIETQLDTEIQSVLEELKNHEKTSEEYATLVEHSAKLHKLKTEERPKPISADTALVVAANIFGVLWVTNYERLHVIPKSLSLVKQPR